MARRRSSRGALGRLRRESRIQRNTKASAKRGVGGRVSQAINRMGRRAIGSKFNRRIAPTKGFDASGRRQTVYDFSKGGLAKAGTIRTGAKERAKLILPGGRTTRLGGRSSLTPQFGGRRQPLAEQILRTSLGQNINIDSPIGRPAIRG